MCVCGKEPDPLVQILLLDSRVQAHWKEALPRRKQGDPPRLLSTCSGALHTQTSVLISAWVHTAPHTYHPEVNSGHTTTKSSRVSQLQGLAPAALGSRQPS